MIGCGGVRRASREPERDLDLDRKPIRYEITLRAAKLYGYELPEGGLPKTVAELEKKKRAQIRSLKEVGMGRVTPAGYGRLAVWHRQEQVGRFFWSGDSHHPVRVMR